MPAKRLGSRATLTLDELWDFEFEGPTARTGGGGHTIRKPGSGSSSWPLRNAQGTGAFACLLLTAML
jgi:hypothetical protein